jgi:hypothetical protein
MTRSGAAGDQAAILGDPCQRVADWRLRGGSGGSLGGTHVGAVESTPRLRAESQLIHVHSRRRAVECGLARKRVWRLSKAGESPASLYMLSGCGPSNVVPA